uniref:Uncharacterized protein n=1 Tax=Cannabis sativa TaxID=3483 RepID=A0A803NKF0_CANSA
MTFLKQAPVLNCKPKAGTATTSPIIPQKRRSDVFVTPAADSSKKQIRPSQDKGKKVMIDPSVRALDFVTLQAKAFVAGSKEVDLLKKQITQLQEINKKLKQDANSKDKDLENLQKSKEQVELQAKLSQSKVEELALDLDTEKENRKKQYDQVVSDYIYTTLSMVPNFDFSILGAEAVEMAEGFHAMSPTQTKGYGGNLFPEEAETTNTEEVADEAASKVTDSSTAPIAPTA